MEPDIARGLIWFVVFLLSTTVHEAMHALVAWKGGDATAYHGGQVTLSPIPHIRREPVGMLVVPLITALTQGWVMGWASAPYDAAWAARYPRRAALMAAAGPAGNFLIAILAFALLKVGLVAGWFVAPDRVSFDAVVGLAAGDGPGFAGTFLSVALMLNVLLGFFNLLPLPPLDGSSVLGLVLPKPAADRVREWSQQPAMSMIGLLVAWRVFPNLTDPLFSIVLRLLHADASYS